MWSTQMVFQHLQPSTTKLALTLILLAACAHVTGIVEHGSPPASMLALLHSTMRADRIPLRRLMIWWEVWRLCSVTRGWRQEVKYWSHHDFL